MTLIGAGEDDPRLRWSADRLSVSPVLSRIPELSARYKQTIEGRRRRFKAAWAAAGLPAGWSRGPGYTLKARGHRDG